MGQGTPKRAGGGVRGTLTGEEGRGQGIPLLRAQGRAQEGRGDGVW